jgi:threonyl-tRNA synthetase
MKITLSDGTVKEYKNSAPEALDILRHSTAHLMARAVMRLYENVQLAFGPTVDNGFYYDLWLEHRLTEEEMKKLIKLDEAFERIELPHSEAVELLAGMGQTLKVEHLNDGLAEEKTVSFYRQRRISRRVVEFWHFDGTCRTRKNPVEYVLC